MVMESILNKKISRSFVEDTHENTQTRGGGAMPTLSKRTTSPAAHRIERLRVTYGFYMVAQKHLSLCPYQDFRERILAITRGILVRAAAGVWDKDIIAIEDAAERVEVRLEYFSALALCSAH